MSEILAFPPELLNRKTAAYMLSTSEWGVKQLVYKSLLTEVNDGGKWAKYRLADVRSYIAALKEKNPDTD
jgi:hypothetical protein